MGVLQVLSEIFRAYIFSWDAIFFIIFMYHIKPWPSGDIGLNPTHIGRWFFHVSFGNKYFVWFINWSVIVLFSIASGIFEVKSVKPVILIRLFSKGDKLKCKSPLWKGWKIWKLKFLKNFFATQTLCIVDVVLNFSSSILLMVLTDDFYFSVFNIAKKNIRTNFLQS